MNQHSTYVEHGTTNVDRSGVEHRLAAVGWGLFFLWVGAALLTGLNTGLGLLGVGVITLGVQGMRMSFGLTVEGFWLLVGLLFALGGVATLFQVNLPVLPVVLVAAGLLLLASALKKPR